MPAQGGLCVVAHVTAINGHAAVPDFVKPMQQRGDRGFAGTGGADQGHRLAPLDGEAYILQHGQIAGISVGIYDGMPVLDLDYAEDSTAETDMNVIMNEAGAFIEVQGTAEGHAFRREELDSMLNLAAAGIAEICQAQINTLVQWRETQL